MAPVSANPTVRPNLLFAAGPQCLVERATQQPAHSAQQRAEQSSGHDAPGSARGSRRTRRRGRADDRPDGGVGDAEPQFRLLAVPFGLPAVQHLEPRLVRGPEHQRGGR